MRRKLISLLLFAVAIVGLPLVVAPAASANQYNSVNCYGYTYNSDVYFSRDGAGGITFAHWGISGPTAFEYRVRWFAPNGTTVVYDTGYVGWQPTSPLNVSPGVSRYWPGYTSTVLINAGLYGDGHATCEMWYTIPQP